MKIARSWKEVVLGIIIFIIFLFFAISEFDIQQGKQLDNVDTTYEEMHGRVR